MPDKTLINFIKDVHSRGFKIKEIKEALLGKGWPSTEIEEAIEHVQTLTPSKVEVAIMLDMEVLRLLEKRAKKNLFSLTQQIEDIVRRSVINAKKHTFIPEKTEDTLVPLFSRRKY